MNCREKWEQKEQTILAKWATFSSVAAREKQEHPCAIRTEFQRDRDRIIHCQAFRRLKDKTQVFLSPVNDHHRTRLTHTMEVTQIARTIARALELNEDLTEAISLGHDLGHTPFGHAGEAVLNKMVPDGFHHARQGIRVVDKLGLNLTLQVKDGILNHSGADSAATLEGQIVKFADRIAYINHDIDDALREGIMDISDLPKQSLDVLGHGHAQRINTLVGSIISESEGEPCVAMQPEIEKEMMSLRVFMFKNVYRANAARDSFAEEVVGKLFEHYTKKGEMSRQDIVDYIAGMTDSFALRELQKITRA